MTIRAQIWTVMTLTCLTMVLIVFGSARTGTVSDCASCHSGSFPDGDYTYRDPSLEIIIPRNLTSGQSFQILVVLEEWEDYDLLDPEATIEMKGQINATVLEESIHLGANDGVWSGLFYARAGSEGQGSVSVVVDFWVHHDHTDDSDPDLSQRELRASKTLTISPIIPDTDPLDGIDESTNDSPSGFIATLVGLTAMTGLVLWRRKRES
jgi:hypothetical protein